VTGFYKFTSVVPLSLVRIISLNLLLASMPMPSDFLPEIVLPADIAITILVMVNFIALVVMAQFNS
jgi:hypothetical protein